MTSLLERLPPSLRKALPLLIPLVLLVPWGLWAIAIDDTPSQPTDSFAPSAGRFVIAASEGRPEVFGFTLGKDKTPPLSAVVAGILVLLFGNTLFALRLGSLLCYLALMWQSYDLSLRAGASRNIAGWGAFICGITPVVFGWGRLDYADVYVAVFYLACLQVMIRGRLTRRRAVVLGLVGGLGVLSKLNFLVYAMAPAVWFIAAHVRRRDQWLNILTTVAVALLVCGWWLVISSKVVFSLFLHSSQAWQEQSYIFPDQSPILIKLDQIKHMLWEIRGFPAVWIGAAGGLILCRGKKNGRARAILGIGSLLCLGPMLLFDKGARYMVALIPAAAVLAALAVDRVTALFGSRRLLAQLGLGGCLFAWFVWLNISEPALDHLRFNGAGMLTPISSYTRACQEANRNRAQTSITYDNRLAGEWLTGFLEEPGRTCSFPPHTEGLSRPCALVLTDHAAPFEGPTAFAVERRKTCPDLALLNRFGRATGVRFSPASGPRTGSAPRSPAPPGEKEPVLP